MSFMCVRIVKKGEQRIKLKIADVNTAVKNKVNIIIIYNKLLTTVSYRIEQFE